MMTFKGRTFLIGIRELIFIIYFNSQIVFIHNYYEILDFNLGRKLNIKSSCGTPTFKSRRTLTNGHRYPKDDWESFLYSMCTHLNNKINWAGKNIKEMLAKKEDTMLTIVSK